MRCRAHGHESHFESAMKANAVLVVVGCVLAATMLRGPFDSYDLASEVVFAQGQQAPSNPGDVLAGTTPREFEEFRIGLEDFREIEEASEGLGPLFNGTG